MTDEHNIQSRAANPPHRADPGKPRATRHGDSERHLGAVEGDRPTDWPNQGNPNAPGLDEEGLPNDPIAICEDVIGANVDESEGG